MKHLFLAGLIAVALSACATKPQPPDARVGSDLTPYRSIPTYIECGDCRMPKK